VEIQKSVAAPLLSNRLLVKLSLEGGMASRMPERVPNRFKEKPMHSNFEKWARSKGYNLGKLNH
jgi:hypothetical protein